MRKTHGMSEEPIYAVWLGMKRRCLKPSSKDYVNYGARGINVCPRWMSFINFLEDMGLPQKGYTLERKNNDLGYFPENCIWATRAAQNLNSRKKRFITANGITMRLTEWAKYSGIGKPTILNRIGSGWTEADAVLVPPGVRRNHEA